MDISAIGGAISATKTALDLLGVATQLRDDAKIKEALRAALRLEDGFLPRLFLLRHVAAQDTCKTPFGIGTSRMPAHQRAVRQV